MFSGSPVFSNRDYDPEHPENIDGYLNLQRINTSGVSYSTNGFNLKTRFFAEDLGPAAYASASSAVNDVGAIATISYSFVIDAQTALAADLFMAAHPTVTANGRYSYSLGNSGYSNAAFVQTQVQFLQAFNGILFSSYNNYVVGGINSGTVSYSAPVTTFRLGSTQIGGLLALSAVAYVGTAAGRSDATVQIDPMLSIDLDFLNNNPGYTITQTYGNILDTYPNQSITGPDTSSAAPEPGTWALMLAGLGGVGAAFRSRRRRPATVA